MPASLYCAIAAVILLFLSVVGHGPRQSGRPDAARARVDSSLPARGTPAAAPTRTPAAPLTASSAAPRVDGLREAVPGGAPTPGATARTRSSLPALRGRVQTS